MNKLIITGVVVALIGCNSRAKDEARALAERNAELEKKLADQEAATKAANAKVAADKAAQQRRIDDEIRRVEKAAAAEKANREARAKEAAERLKERRQLEYTKLDEGDRLLVDEAFRKLSSNGLAKLEIMQLGAIARFRLFFDVTDEQLHNAVLTQCPQAAEHIAAWQCKSDREKHSITFGIARLSYQDPNASFVFRDLTPIARKYRTQGPNSLDESDRDIMRQYPALFPSR